MKNIQYEFEHVSIHYSAVNQYLIITWRGEIDAEKMMHGYQLSLEIFKTQPVQRCLIDMTRRTLLVAGTEPVITDVFASLLTIIQQPLFVGLVVPPEVYFNITDHYHYEHLHQDDNHFVIIKHFLNQDSAEEWLNSAPATFHSR